MIKVIFDKKINTKQIKWYINYYLQLYAKMQNKRKHTPPYSRSLPSKTVNY